MKLRLSTSTTEKLRALSSVYDLPMQKIVKRAEIAYNRGRVSMQIESPTLDAGGTVIDVTNDYSAEIWRKIIRAYCNREIDRVDEILSDLMTEQRQEAKRLRSTLPKVIM